MPVEVAGTIASRLGLRGEVFPFTEPLEFFDSLESYRITSTVSWWPNRFLPIIVLAIVGLPYLRWLALDALDAPLIWLP